MPITIHLESEIQTLKTLVGEGNGNPLQCSCLENPRDDGAWWAALGGVAQESDMIEWLHFHSLKKEMAIYSNVLAWRIPGVKDPGRLPSMGSHRVDTTEATEQSIAEQDTGAFMRDCLTERNIIWRK